jgi:uncharacterized protein DUF6188
VLWSVKVVDLDVGIPVVAVPHLGRFPNRASASSKNRTAANANGLSGGLELGLRASSRPDISKAAKHGFGADNGMRLIVPPDQDFEPWDFNGPRGEKVISLPGGGLATWSAKT